MKKLTKSAFLASLCLAAAVAANVSYASVSCSDKTCSFTGLTDEENQNSFNCQVIGQQKPSEVIFTNNSVLVTGFSKDGKLILHGDQVDLLSKYYFDAKQDKLPAGWVSFSTKDGNISCSSGTGGRTTKWPGPYGK